MDQKEVERQLREACNTASMCKLNTLARELTGVGLLAVWSCGDIYGQLPVCDSERELPRFCQLLHEMPLGLRRCVTCHSLLALAARDRGQVTEGRCYGGACVVAAPASVAGLKSEMNVVVISSCAFTMTNRQRGWKVTRKLAQDLGIDLTQLRRAYAELPDVTGEKLKLIGNIVDAAAAALTEALRGRSMVAEGIRVTTPASRAVEETLRAALQAAAEPAARHATGTVQATLVDVVRSVVAANPQLPVTVADIARAAHITPNHFSLIFRRQTGTTFTEFLADKRFERATERLRDLTLSIAEVATESGYPDPNYFAKVFHKRTGMSPRAWRHPATASRAKRQDGFS